jgi:hypothetical protein
MLYQQQTKRSIDEIERDLRIPLLETSLESSPFMICNKR